VPRSESTLSLVRAVVAGGREALDLGDLQSELGVQIVDVRISTRKRNGGLVELVHVASKLRGVEGGVVTEDTHSPKLNFVNRVCESDDAKAALRSILAVNDAATGRHTLVVSPQFSTKGEQILPDQFPDLKEAIVKVAATISHEVVNGDRGKFDYFYADLSYITVLEHAPPSPLSLLKKRGGCMFPPSSYKETMDRMTHERLSTSCSTIVRV